MLCLFSGHFQVMICQTVRSQMLARNSLIGTVPPHDDFGRGPGWLTSPLASHPVLKKRSAEVQIIFYTKSSTVSSKLLDWKAEAIWIVSDPQSTCFFHNIITFASCFWRSFENWHAPIFKVGQVILKDSMSFSDYIPNFFAIMVLWFMANMSIFDIILTAKRPRCPFLPWFLERSTQGVRFWDDFGK